MAGSSSGDSMALLLAPDLSLVPCLAEDTLREVEPFLGIRQILSQALKIMFQRLEASRNVLRRQFRASGPYLRNLDDRVRHNRRDRNEWGKKLWIHEAFPRWRKSRLASRQPRTERIREPSPRRAAQIAA